MSRTRSARVHRGLLGLLTASLLLPALAAAAQEGMDFTALAIREEGNATRSVIHITIDRWSTAEERAALVKAFREGGQDALLKALQKQPKAGYVNLPQTVARDIYYAYKFPGENGGSIVVIVTDRIIRQGEVMNSNMSLEYPFGFVEMHLDAEGKGEGTLSQATKVSVAEDGKTLKLGSYGSGPMMLKEVKAKPRKAGTP